MLFAISHTLLGLIHHRYGIKEIRRHGEAGSVDLAAVEKERARLAPILAEYSPEDTLNFDETGLYALSVLLHFASSHN